MSWSFGEIAALATKAAVGAKYSWGMAEEIGWAVRWLSEKRQPGAEALAAMLSDQRGRCPVFDGLKVADMGNLDLLRGEVRQPLMMMPFLSRLAPFGRAISLRVGDERAMVSQTALEFDACATVAAVRVDGEGVLTPSKKVGRIEEIEPEALAILQKFAHLTYAPATEASRLSGAGAGLTDQD